MSLHAYCRKASDGDQNYHCNKKCIKCMIHIAMVQQEWKRLFNKQWLLTLKIFYDFWTMNS